MTKSQELGHYYLAILETMWGWGPTGRIVGERAPAFFSINPDNFSGRRLYWLLGNDLSSWLQVTNVCTEVVSGPDEHGKPDKDWLSSNLDRWRKMNKLPHRAGLSSTVLCCGRIAQETFDKVDWRGLGRIILLPHPAARHWTRVALTRARLWIRDSQRDLALTVEQGRLVARGLAPRCASCGLGGYGFPPGVCQRCFVLSPTTECASGLF